MVLGAKQLWDVPSAAIYRGKPGAMAVNLSQSRSRYERNAFCFSAYGADGHFGRAISTAGSVHVLVPTSASRSTCWQTLYGIEDYPFELSLDVAMNNIVTKLDLNPLLEVLPVMHRTFYSCQWSLLQRYCCPQDTIIDINEALENEVVAMCVWFLFIDTPTHAKEGVAWALKDICSRTSENNIVAQPARTKMPSFDQCVKESVNALLVEVLSSKNEEVLRQVCYSLCFVAEHRSYQVVSIGNGIQKKLIQLSRDFKCDSPMLAHVLHVINKIGLLNKCMKERIIEAELSDGFLRRILRREGHHNCFLETEVEVYYMVCNIAHGHCSDELWRYLKEHLMPPILDRCFVSNINVMKARACVIWSFVFKAPPLCIKELVDIGCLETLISFLTIDYPTIKDYCMNAVDTILSLGDADPSKNEYAKMIDDLSKEWGVFIVNDPLPRPYEYLVYYGSDIVKKYRPNKYLEWVKLQEYCPDSSI